MAGTLSNSGGIGKRVAAPAPGNAPPAAPGLRDPPCRNPLLRQPDFRHRIASPITGRPGPSSEARHYRRIAEDLRLPFSTLDGCRLDPAMRSHLYRDIAPHVRVARVITPNGARLVMAPALHQLGPLKALLAKRRAVADRLVIAPPSAIRALLLNDPRSGLMRAALFDLRDKVPLFSARRIVTPRQAVVMVAVMAILAALALVQPSAFAALVLVLLGLLFLAGTLLRVAILAAWPLTLEAASGARTLDDPVEPTTSADEWPVYTVLVPLYREARVVAPLVAALDRLDYPRARLDIKLLLEADDRTTRAAVEALDLGHPYEVVVLPPHLPRTKPSALNVGLLLARGALVTVYDAEDRPDPAQLRQAARILMAEPETGVVQARLAYRNWDTNWLTRQFAVEYTALFDVMLPALERLDLPILLGGTSNHFRTETLRRIGGWDPFNVTEDADLGIRLARCGFRTRILASTTFEEAPARLKPWVVQRSRWIKGWLQTLLVHLRAPVALFRDLGSARALGLLTLLIGGATSSLAMPVTAMIMAGQMLGAALFATDGNGFQNALMFICMVNLLAGYGVALTIAALGCGVRRMPRLALSLPTTIVYWALIGLGAVKAGIGLARAPFHWDKTEHGLDTGRARDLPHLVDRARPDRRDVVKGPRADPGPLLPARAGG